MTSGVYKRNKEFKLRQRKRMIKLHKGNTYNLGRKHSLEIRKRMSEAHIGVQLGKKHPMFGKHWSKEIREKMSKTRLGKPAWNKGKEYLQIRGKNNPNWKGGITPKNQLDRKSIKYKEWRKKVFKKDDYTCQGCDIKGGYLEPHHLIAWAHYPKYRYESWNGQTACKPCHDNLHNELGRR